MEIHRNITDKLLVVGVWVTAIAVTCLFAWILSDILSNGLKNLSWTFLIESPHDAGRSGGIASVLVSTCLILIICLVVALPLGFGTAVLLAEYTSEDKLFGRIIRCNLDVLAGVPSIVFGLFGNAFFCIYLGMGFSILSGGLTLACMVLPILIRSTEAGFRSVSDDYRRAAAGLGMGRARTLVYILLPVAAPGLAVGIVLGIGRAIAETAALLFTSGYVDRMPGSVLDSGRSISIHIYDLSMNVPGGESNAYTTALVLVILLVVINWTSTWVTNRFSGGNLLY